VILSDGSSKALQKKVLQKGRVEKFLQKNRQKRILFRFSEGQGWAFLGEGISKTPSATDSNQKILPANGRATNEHMAIKRILLGSACMHLQKGQYTEAARLLDTSRHAISASTALAIGELDPEIPGQGLIFELRRGFLKVRGLERSNGQWAALQNPCSNY
jgi:hypothetical protein